MKKYVAGLMLVIGSITMIGCGGDDGDSALRGYSVGGVVTGLPVAGPFNKVTLSLVGGSSLTEEITVENGAFSFVGGVRVGTHYAVGSLQTSCVVENGTGEMPNHNITDIVVTCE
jgi:hypothetical protein